MRSSPLDELLDDINKSHTYLRKIRLQQEKIIRQQKILCKQNRQYKLLFVYHKKKLYKQKILLNKMSQNPQFHYKVHCSILSNIIEFDTNQDTNKEIYEIIAEKLNVPITKLLLCYNNSHNQILYNDDEIIFILNKLNIIAVISNYNSLLFCYMSNCYDNKIDIQIINIFNRQLLNKFTCISKYDIEHLIFNFDISIMVFIYKKMYIYIFTEDINIVFDQIINNKLDDLEPYKIISLNKECSNTYMYFYDDENIIYIHEFDIYKINIIDDISIVEIYIHVENYIDYAYYSPDTKILQLNNCFHFINFDTKKKIEILYFNIDIPPSFSINNTKIIIHSNNNQKYNNYTDKLLDNLDYIINYKQLYIIDIISKSIIVYNHLEDIRSYSFIDNDKFVILDNLNNIYLLNINNLSKKELIYGTKIHIDNIYAINENIMIYKGRNIYVYNLNIRKIIFNTDINYTNELKIFQSNISTN